MSLLLLFRPSPSIVGPPPVSVALSGTASSGLTSDLVRSGGRTIVLTVTNDTWVAAGAAFDAIRANLLAGLDSAQAEAAGWDAVVKAGQSLGGIVRTSATVVTITLDAFPAYTITVPETITALVPGVALTLGGSVFATPTFSVAVSVAPVVSASLSGTLAASAHEADVVAGGRTLILTLVNATWVAAGAAFDAVRSAILNGISAAQAEAGGWNAVVKPGQSLAGVVRASNTVVVITLDAFPLYDITAPEGLAATIPAAAITGGLAPVPAPPMVAITPDAVIITPPPGTPSLGVGGETFLRLYGTLLDRELGSSDRTQRFTVALRKEYINEGHRKFNEQTSCFIKRCSIALTGGQADYDVEETEVIAAGDYLWPSKTTASLRRYDAAAALSYDEGPHLPFRSEEELNQTRPGWRAESTGKPEFWTLREDGGSQYLVLVPTPDVPTAETWALLWPYVAVAPDLVNDADIPYSVDGNPRTTLYPYHEAIVYYAAAQLEKLRKNYDGSERQLKYFAATVSKFFKDLQPKRGSHVRLAQDYRRRLRTPWWP